MKTYIVPPGTNPARCRENKCGAEIFWIEYPGVDKKTKERKTIRNPIDCRERNDTPGCVPPTASLAGQGVSHFQTCTAAHRFSKR